MSVMNEQEREAFIEKVNEKHQVWHSFSRWAKETFGENWESPEVLSGYEVMQKIEEYVKNNSNSGIQLSYCDDTMFSGSMIVLVPHKEMGTTVLYIPQLTHTTNQFFLYPSHQKMLVESLTKIEQEIHKK